MARVIQFIAIYLLALVFGLSIINLPKICELTTQLQRRVVSILLNVIKLDFLEFFIV